MKDEIVKEEVLPNTELIVVRQLPIIEQSLRAIKQQFITAAEDALAMECSEETLQEVKKRRAEISKVYHLLESKRKEAKKAVLAPYEEFEKIYKECVTEIYAPCDDQLSNKIREVEDGLKAKKREEAVAFFEEYAQSKGIDFLTFEQSGITVTMSVSKKSLRDQSKAFLDKVAEEIQLIQTQENAEEIFLEYKKTLNVANAITLVSRRHAEIEQVRKQKEQQKVAREAMNEAAAKAAAVAEAESTSEEAAFSPPKAEGSEAVLDEPSAEKIFEVSFTVRGTLPGIKELKTFLIEGGYEYEQN